MNFYYRFLIHYLLREVFNFHTLYGLRNYFFNFHHIKIILITLGRFIFHLQGNRVRVFHLCIWSILDTFIRSLKIDLKGMPLGAKKGICMNYFLFEHHRISEFLHVRFASAVLNHLPGHQSVFCASVFQIEGVHDELTTVGGMVSKRQIWRDSLKSNCLQTTLSLVRLQVSVTQVIFVTLIALVSRRC